MSMLRLLAAMVLAGAAAASLAQSGETQGRGSIPPGESRDESRPAEGAIKGGSIEPDIGTSRVPERDVERCKQLAAVLREQCLRDLGAGAGGGGPSRSAPAQRDPITEPPPQNPRQPR